MCTPSTHDFAYTTPLQTFLAFLVLSQFSAPQHPHSVPSFLHHALARSCPFPPMTSSFTAVAPLPSPPVDCSSQLSSGLIPHRPFLPQLPITRAILLTIILFRHIRSCCSTNPIDIVSSASEDALQEYHIIWVTDDAVCMQSACSSCSIVHKVAEPFLTVVACSEVRECSIGPPPSSPPVSNGHPDEDQVVNQVQGLDPVPPFKCRPVSIAPRYRSPRLSFSSTHNSPLPGPGPSSLSLSCQRITQLVGIIPSRRLPPLPVPY